RYGSMEEVSQEVVEELKASYDEERLNRLVKLAFQDQNTTSKQIETRHISLKDLDHPDWRKRYAALDRMNDPTIDDLDVLNKALDDEHSSIRRLATAYLGMKIGRASCRERV